MKLSQVCIDRPVLASVMSIIIALAGLVSLAGLSSRELPDIDPPVVSVTTVFPGAAPEVVEASVTDVIEDQVNGIAGVKHVFSESREQTSAVSVVFNLDVDPEEAANDVRDRVSRARRDLPEAAEDPVVAKSDMDSYPDVWVVLRGERYDQIELTTLAETRFSDRFEKLPGVANVILAGGRRYAMRVWIDNAILNSFGLTVTDVQDALARENVDIPSGRVESTDAEFTVRSLGELQSAEEFRNLIIGSRSGALVRLRDVAHVEVGAETARMLVRINGKPSVGLGVVKQSKANAVDVVRAVRAQVEAMQSELPPGVELGIAYDGAEYIERAIRDVTRSIFEAAFLVVLVIYVFLRTARATLIPAVSIPISILGSFIALNLAGFTLNTLTLMGVTLAIGLVVDDAIVVLENITRWIESGVSRLEAARRGMEEISFAVLAATVSSVAVFVPLTFLTDETGRLFREFALTVAAALAVSGFVAITLAPALCARVLREGDREATGTKAVLAGWFDRLAESFGRFIDAGLSRPGLVLALGGLWVLLGAAIFTQLEEELVPMTDRGYVRAFTQAPEGSSLDYMDRYHYEVERAIIATPGVKTAWAGVGFGPAGVGAVNEGFVFIGLLPPEQRDLTQSEIAAELGRRFEGVAGIKAFAYEPMPLRGMGRSPVELRIQGPDLVTLSDVCGDLVQRLMQTGAYGYQNCDIYLNKPQFLVEIDRDRASDLGVSVRDIARTLQVMLGGRDLSSFKLGGETYDVVAQLALRDRDDPRDLLSLTVRSVRGHQVSLSSVVRLRETVAPRAIAHYDRTRSVRFTTQLGSISQGAAIAQVTELLDELLPEEGGYRYALSGEAEKFVESGQALTFAYALALVVVYLVLAAQFESFIHPLVIMAAVALSFTGALVALGVVSLLGRLGITELAGTLNLFSKIGLVMLVGLVTKNAILIVEFANQLRERGIDAVEAARQAARARFRPILMTALATVMGLLPIAFGRGTGGEARAPLGIAVVGGVLFSTLLAFVVVPATYVMIERLRERLRGGSRVADTVPQPLAGGGS